MYSYSLIFCHCLTDGVNHQTCSPRSYLHLYIRIYMNTRGTLQLIIWFWVCRLLTAWRAQLVQLVIAGWTIWSSKPGWGKKIFLPHNRPHWSWDTSRLLHNVYRDFVPGCDVGHLPLLAPKLKMGEVVPLLPLCACIGELRNDLYPYLYAFTNGVDTLSVWETAVTNRLSSIRDIWGRVMEGDGLSPFWNVVSPFVWKDCGIREIHIYDNWSSRRTLRPGLLECDWYEG